jgi:Ankyrin repeats (3 copies)
MNFAPDQHATPTDLTPTDLTPTDPTPTDSARKDAPVTQPLFQRIRQWFAFAGTRPRVELLAVALVSVVMLGVSARVWRPQVPASQLDLNEPLARPCAAGSNDFDSKRLQSLLNELEKDEKTVHRLEPYRACLEADPHWVAKPSLLERATKLGQFRSVKWLVGTGLLREDELTLAVATADSHPEIVSYLHAHGAKDPTVEQAAERNAPNAIARILAAGQPSEDALTSALEHFLAVSADARTIRLLVTRGARTTASAIGILAQYHTLADDETLDLLLDNRLPGALEAGLELMPEDAPVKLVRKLVARGVDWGHEGQSDAALPLVKMVESGNEPMISLFVELGAPVGRVYRDGRSALQAAVSCGDDDPRCGRITEYLLDHGADPNRRFPDGTTPLFAAAESGNGRVIRALLDHGARLEDRVVRETAMNAAERTGNTKAARILAARGARF